MIGLVNFNPSFDTVFRQTDQYEPSNPIESGLGQLGQAGQAKTTSLVHYLGAALLQMKKAENLVEIPRDRKQRE